MEAPPIEKKIAEYEEGEKKALEKKKILEKRRALKEQAPSNPHEQALREQKIESSSKLNGGINKTFFVKIKKGGEGVFKPGSGERSGTPEKGKGYKRERAVYLVDMFLGFNLVPPTVIRTIKNEEGSLQEFIPKHTIGGELGRDKTTNNPDFMEQASRMMLLDVLISNGDRHGGNYLVEKKSGKLWAIDNGCTLSGSSDVGAFMGGSVCRRTHEFTYDDESIQKLKELNEDEKRKQVLFNLLLELVGKREISLFFKRLELISSGISENRLSKEVLKLIERDLEIFLREYDKKIIEFIQNPKTQGLTHQEVADQLFSEGQMLAVAEHLSRFKKHSLDSKTARQLIEAGFVRHVSFNRDKFKKLDRKTRSKLY